jgi:cytochrome c oxidase cbb3-type subunit IV
MLGIDWATTGGVMTVLALLLFVGVAIWAWSPARKQRFDEAAQIPLQDEDDAGDTPGMQSRAADASNDEENKS